MGTVTVYHYVVLSFLLFALGVVGVLIRRNILIMLMAVELMLNGGNLALLAFSRYLGNDAGHALALFVITVAAAEAAIGLALVIALFRVSGKVNVDEFKLLRG